MQRLGVGILALLLSACGGSSGGSDGDSGLPGGGDSSGSGNQNVQAIDCSADKSQLVEIPVPEYAGNYSAYNGEYDELEGGGFDPENFVEIAAGMVVMMSMYSEEGFMHKGPRWTVVDDQLTTYLDYTKTAEGEVWQVTKNGFDGETQFNMQPSMRMEQPSDCGYNEYHYEDDGSLSSAFESSRYAWTLKSYNAGIQDGVIETEIAPDRSGRTVAVDIPPADDHPYTIMTWDGHGENIVIRYCNDKEGMDCVAAVAE